MEGVKYYISVAGYSILGGGGENVALGVVGLQPWNKRTAKSLSIESLTNRLTETFAANAEAEINFLPLRQFPASAIRTACLWNCWQ